MYEAILREWSEQEEEEEARSAAQRRVEELAWRYLGGIAFKGAGVLVDLSLPVLKSALGKGGVAAAGWLQTTVSRLPADNKKAFERL